MPVFDQYEVEPVASYSGSYTDDAIFGDMFVTAATLVSGYTPVGQNDPKTSRRLIASRVSDKSATYPNINKMWIPNYIIDGYASGSWLNKLQNIVSFFSYETNYDSYMPNPVDIYLLNGGTLYGASFYDVDQILGPTVNETSGSAFGINSFATPDVYPGQDIGINLAFVDKGYVIGPIPSGWDYIWAYKHPFQSSYKSVKKVLKFNKTLPTKYTINTTFDLTTITPASQSNEIVGLARAKNGFIDYLFGYMNHPNEAWQYGSFISPVTPPAVGSISTVDLYHSIFGVGKGSGVYNTLQSVGGTSYLNSGPDYEGYWAVGGFLIYVGIFSTVKIRGYKYGIKAAQPEQQKIVYRRGRFGQLRDVLEARITTATLTEGGVNPYNNLPIQRTLFYPIQVAFVSGTAIYNQSRDYVTATNPDYNPYDSGIYDIYYRSGQPFFDRENED